MRTRQAPAVAGAGLAAVVAMLAAGMFEYNFGDSEFLMLFLNTYRAVQHHVRVRALDAIDVKGFSAPVPVYEVLGLRAERESESPVAVAP